MKEKARLAKIARKKAKAERRALAEAAGEEAIEVHLPRHREQG